MCTLGISSPTHADSSVSFQVGSLKTAVSSLVQSTNIRSGRAEGGGTEEIHNRMSVLSTEYSNLKEIGVLRHGDVCASQN